MTVLREYSTGSPGMRVDHQRGIIKGVSLLGNGGRSANGRRYTPRALAEGLHLFRNCPVYVNHHRGRDDRKAEDKVARVINPRIEKGNVVGDLECLRSHPLFPRLAEAATDRPWAFQMSINGHGRIRRDGGEQVVEALEGLSSCDVVAEGATNNSLLAEGKKVGTTTMRRLLEIIRRHRPKAAKVLHEAADDAGLDMGSEVPADEGGSHEDLLKAGFKAAIAKIVDDDSMESAEKLAKIKELLKHQDQLVGQDDDDDETDDEPTYGSSKESRRKKPRRGTALAESAGQFAGRLLGRRVLSESGRAESAAFVRRLTRRR